MDLLTPLIQQYGGFGLVLFGLFVLFWYMRSEAKSANKRADEIEKHAEETERDLRTELKERVADIKAERADDLRQFNLYKTEAERRINELSEKVKQLMTELGEYDNRVKRLADDLRKANEQILAKEQANIELAVENRELQAMNDRQAAVIRTLESKLTDFEARIGTLEQELKRRETESAAREARILELQELVKTHTAPPTVAVFTASTDTSPADSEQKPDTGEGSAAA